MAGILDQVPFLNGVMATRRANEASGANQMGQMTGAMGILGALQQQAARQQAQERQQQLHGILSGVQKPEDAIPLLMQRGFIAEAEKVSDAVKNLRGPLPKVPEGFTLGPGQRRYGPDNTLIAESPFKEPNPQQPSDLARLIAERDAIPQGDPRRVSYDNAIRKMSEIPRQIVPQIHMPRAEQPLVAIVGPDGKPLLVRREEAIGKTPWAAGSKADQKAGGKQQLADTVDRLAASYDTLANQGAVVDPNKSAIGNAWERAAASGIGQTIAGFAGTKAQTERDKIANARASLMAALKETTGMSAQQLNSNAELMFYMQMATDPTKSIEANRDALAYFDRTYDLGLGIDGNPERLKAVAPRQTSTGRIGQGVPAARVPPGIDPKVWAAMTPDERKLFQ